MTRYKRILVGVDESKDAVMALDAAIQLAKRDAAELVIVRVLEKERLNIYQTLDSDYLRGEHDELKQQLRQYRRQALAAGVSDVRMMLTSGSPGESIVKDVIPDVKPDVLVIGALTKHGLSRHFGSQAAYMAKYAPITVIVVR
ncbi:MULTISPECIES: universal stress protein [Lactobacillaceae]|uniref:universal stress protein n=1 Tax=Lactobacillaceae TaxID=33958 RepID=UPI00145720CA|nr:universal stress protein [Lactobacillus sp. HBUAS51381]NLR10159.1 universal stress protein [Lactobacillus sp. HBUAS51381]